MKRLILLAVLMGLTGIGSANCGNDNGNGNGCSGNTGPQGPQGPQGPAGQNGTNGKNGADGQNGTNGTNGANGTDAAAQPNVGVYVGLDVEWAEAGPFSFSSGYHYDARRNDHLIDALTIGLKLGKSSEERRIEALEKQLKQLQGRK